MQKLEMLRRRRLVRFNWSRNTRADRPSLVCSVFAAVSAQRRISFNLVALRTVAAHNTVTVPTLLFTMQYVITYYYFSLGEMVYSWVLIKIFSNFQLHLIKCWCVCCAMGNNVRICHVVSRVAVADWLSGSEWVAIAELIRRYIFSMNALIWFYQLKSIRNRCENDGQNCFTLTGNMSDGSRRHKMCFRL